MTKHKQQVWFRPDQARLVVDALEYMKRRAEEPNNLSSAIDRFAKRYLVSQIDDVIALFRSEQTNEHEPVA